MTITIEQPTAARPEPSRDRYGRYLLPQPAGKDKGYTRATTVAKTLSDTYGLTRWQVRMTAQGLSQRPDLFARVASAAGDAKSLDQICEQAKEAAAASSGANIGTALHAFTEAVDAGRPVTIPAPWDADVAAYTAALQAAEVTVDPAYIETVLALHSLEVAGTMDRLVTMPDGRRLIADLKTGKDLSYGWGEIAIQLALYANADETYDYGTGQYGPMPEVDLDEALVMHLPAGQARCDLYLVDIAAGWEAVELCAAVRTWRKRKGLAYPLAPDLPAQLEASMAEPVAVAEALPAAVDDLHQRRTEWVTGRLADLKASPVARDIVRRAWPAEVPPKPPWTAEQIDALVPALSAGEAGIRASFPDPDPARPSTVTPHTPPAPPPSRAPGRTLPEGGPMVDGTATRDAARALPPEAVAVMRRWLGDAKREGRSWGPPSTGQWSTRTVALVEAATACLTHLCDDELIRAALTVVLGEDVQRAWHTGAVIGSLTIDEADRLTQIAGAFADDDAATITALGLIAGASPPSQPHTGAVTQ